LADVGARLTFRHSSTHRLVRLTGPGIRRAPSACAPGRATIRPPRARNFRLLWAGRTTSELGSALVPVALSFAVLDVGSASDLGFVLTVGFVSRIALVLLGGLVADRLQQHRVMVVADALRAGTQGTVAALFLTGEAQLWQLLVLFALYGAGDAFFSPASTGLVPRTVESGELQRANALLSGSRSVATVAGPALAGVIVAAAGVGVVFAIDAATFAVSTGTLLALRLAPQRAGGQNQGVLAELRLGWREVAGRTWVWTSIAYFAVSNLAIAPLFVLGPLVAKQSLDGARAWGLILTCAGFGSLLGDAAALRLRPRRALAPGYLLLTTWALAPALLARPFPTAVVSAGAALGFAALSFSNTLWLTTLQEGFPAQYLSRVSSYDWLGSRLFQPAGYALAGPAAALVGVPATLLAGAVLHASASIAIALQPSVRTLQRADVHRR
jgi:MFS family permease